MDVKRRDHIRQRLSRVGVTAGEQMWACTPQANAREPHRFLVIVGREDAARGHNPRLASRWQRVKVSVDDGMLNLGKRRARRFLGARLRARQQQAVARLACPRPTAHGKGRLPDAVAELRSERIKRIAARKRTSGERIANDIEIAREDLVALRAVETKGRKGRGVSAGPDPELE